MTSDGGTAINGHATPSADGNAATTHRDGTSAAVSQPPGRKIRLLLCFTGSVASVKAIPLYEQLAATQRYDIRICLSQRATAFIDIPALRQLVAAQHSNGVAADWEGSGVYSDDDEWRSYKRGDPVLHIELRKWADMLVIAPLSANTLAKLATGLADNLTTCVARAWDIQACRAQAKPILVAPAMNTLMYVHPVTQQHLRALEVEYGYTLINPISKMLACGDIGIGAMASVDEIVRVIEHKCKTVDVTSIEDMAPATALQSLQLSPPTSATSSSSPSLTVPLSRFYQLRTLEPAQRVLVIGDVHGCIDELQQLVATSQVDVQRDVIISVGDLISKDKVAKAEKTASSLAVIDFCMQHGILVAAGNHESKLLRCAAKLGRLQRLTASASDALTALPSYQRYKFPPLTHDYMYHAEATTNRRWPDEPTKSQHYAIAEAMNDLQLAWVASLPLTIDFEVRRSAAEAINALAMQQYRICHAGQKPNTPLLQQTADNTTLLRTVHSIGNVTNMEQTTAAADNDLLVPWATKWQPVNAHTGQPQPFILFGHDARLQLQVHPHAIGLDTGCCYGYALTGIVLPERRLVQVSAARAYEKEDPMKPEFKQLLDSYAAFARLDMQVAQQMIDKYLPAAG